jgi:hypothetical protein
METIKVNGHIMQVYSSIKELPIRLTQEFRSYVLQDLGIGSSISDIDDHLEKLFLFAQRNQPEDVMNEAKNLRYNLFNMITQADLKSRSFACLIQSIDNVIFKTTDDAHKMLIETDMSSEAVDEWLDKIKKNLMLSEQYISQSFMETTQPT